ncbi:Rrf2 family transcriptional regulator [Streptacidiphilus sp. ASG 303]|uniref:Rrf2 family transcriptional regulator n=1 Tax=Streptacidiphilus sp. ASG 303 TaxID=2896847 RepID=UPI001E36A383|nr:Rrf2 family transcriptional regulator [Streptacidiphilus sp. ASG 303]MCD0484121.1 Rrf2 family transcriptional regulator [Streptacidiphilus sp. ASG 303]
MGANSRMTIAVHVLTWMSLDRHDNEVATSERIAVSVNTNPVVIRRCLGDLRKAGLVQSKRGAGAGWTLAREPEEITLREVYRAVGGGGLFGMHYTPPNTGCPIGFGIQPALQRVYSGLEEQMEEELSHTTVAEVLRNVLAQQR